MRIELTDVELGRSARAEEGPSWSRARRATRYYSGSSDSGPAARDLYAETSGEIKAKVDTAPSVYAAEAQYRPAYTSLDLQDMEQQLFGTAGTSRTIQYQDQEWVPPQTAMQQQNPYQPGTVEYARWQNQTMPNMVRANGGQQGAVTPGYWKQVMKTKTVDVPAQAGYLDMARRVGSAADEITAASQTRQRTADIQDVANLGTASRKAMEQADPEQAALIGGITSQAQQGLDMGGALDPATLRQVQQSVRGRYAGRLGAGGPAGDLQEAMSVGDAATQTRAARMSTATGATQLRQSVYGDALSRVLGRPASGGATPYLNTAYQMQRSAGPTLFGTSISANDVADSNFNAANASSIANKNNAAAQQSAYIGAGASIAASVGIAI